MLDGLLVNLGCGENFTISGYGLAPGTHTAGRRCSPTTGTTTSSHRTRSRSTIARSIRSRLPRGVALGTPGAQLVSPQDGATVPAQFAVVVNTINFVPTGDLSGKPNVAGYGQWLVRVDGKDVSYGLGTTFPVDLTAWGPGSHTIGVLPVQNNHHGFEGVSPLEFQVVVEAAATPTP